MGYICVTFKQFKGGKEKKKKRKGKKKNTRVAKKNMKSVWESNGAKMKKSGEGRDAEYKKEKD